MRRLCRWGSGKMDRRMDGDHGLVGGFDVMVHPWPGEFF